MSKRLTTTAPNGYTQQPLVIPGWSNTGMMVNQGGQSLGQDQNGLVRDWRPDLAYNSQQIMEGLSMDFGISQQRLFPTLRPDLNLSSTSSLSSSITIPKNPQNSKPRSTGSRSKKSASSSSTTTESSKLSNWSKGGDVVEKFIWGGKWECEKLGSGEFVCLACGKTKNSRPLLVTHLNYHRLLESKRFSCTLCQKSFSRQREVERHEKTHLTKGR